MNYISTRGNYQAVQGAEAIVLGMVPRGGLFVPDKLPEISLHSLRYLSYQELSYAILKLFLEGEEGQYSEAEIKDNIINAYNLAKFDTAEIAPMRFLNKNTGVLELWHGPTAAFKDMALQIMPYFLTGGIKKLNRRKEVVILVATSGDTGKAALEGFKDVPGTRIIVFYPKDGVSRIQELQMLTTGGSNTSVIGVKGNFDDCQTMVKDIFADTAFNNIIIRNGFEFSSANSINWGRLVPQIIYYFWAYLTMARNKSVGFGDPINACVPTGNFGNILAGYYAREMGLPIKRLICASNKNNVLTDFINTGIYNRKREFHKTSSPSMDILISSNLERFLFEVSNHNALKINRWYEELSRDGRFKIDDSSFQRIKNVLTGGFATEEATFAQIKATFDGTGYLVDTHTAVGISVHEAYKKASGDNTPTFICGTASPYKFNQPVYTALTGDTNTTDEFSVLNKLHDLSKMPIHRGLTGLDKETVRHDQVIPVKDGRQAILSILNIKI